jgi:hypothetical protein
MVRWQRAGSTQADEQRSVMVSPFRRCAAKELLARAEGLAPRVPGLLRPRNAARAIATDEEAIAVVVVLGVVPALRANGHDETLARARGRCELRRESRSPPLAIAARAAGRELG